jgi:hypothetical protein
VKCASLEKDATLSGDENTSRSAGSATGRAARCAGGTFVNGAGAFSAAGGSDAQQP